MPRFGRLGELARIKNLSMLEEVVVFVIKARSLQRSGRDETPIQSGSLDGRLRYRRSCYD
jgi:hypothetical protein